MMLDDLAVFLAVAAAGNMSEAARRVGLPKSSVSRTIRRLEEGLALRLFERSTRHLRLTSDGQHLLDQTRPLVERLQETLAVSTRQSEVPQGVLRICAPYEFGLLRLGDVVTRLLERHPQLEVDIELSSRLPDPRVEDYDLVFRIQVGGLPDSDQVARRIYSFERALFATPALLERCGAPSSLADLASLPCLISPEEAVWRLRDDEGQVHDFQPLSRLRTVNSAMRLQGVVAGLGVGLLSLNYCRDELASGRIVRVLPELRPLPAWVYALLPARRLMPAKVREFLAMLEAKMAENRAPEDLTGAVQA